MTRLQVSNLSDAIKIACDFLSVESLSASRQLMDEFRMQRLVHKWPEDVLQLELTLWYAWTSLSKLQNRAPVSGMDPVSLPTSPTFALTEDPLSSEDANTHPDLSPSRQEKRREKRRAHRIKMAVAARMEKKPGHTSRCPRCPSGYFNRHGILCHL